MPDKPSYFIPVFPRISDYVRWFAVRAPHAEALTIGPHRITYRELDARVDDLAKALISAGVGKGDRVATLSTPHPDYFVAFLATTSIGGIWVGLNPRYRTHELSCVIQDSDPKILLTRTRIGERKYADEIRCLRQATQGLRRIVVLGEDPLFEEAQSYDAFVRQGDSVSSPDLAAARATCGDRDPCMIVYTSGSTGQPKGALLCHQAIVAFGAAQNRVWPVSVFRTLNYFPINHVGCVVDISCPTLIGGGCIVFLEHFDPETALRLVASERLTMWGSVPSVFQMQLDLPEFDAHDLSSVELIIWEGAAMPERIIRKLLSVCPRLATNYGLTETTSAVTVVTPTANVEILVNSVGTAFEGVEIRLVGPDGLDVSEGTEGEIWTRSIYNMLGYWRRPQDTSQTLLSDGWLRTGDLAIKRPDNRYRIVGRLKEMYKSGGYNVYPREIEQIIESHPAVSLSAVVGTPDPLWQEVGVAYVITRYPVTAAELSEYCHSMLANYKVPKRFEFRSELPLLPIGKVDKLALRREQADRRPT